MTATINDMVGINIDKCNNTFENYKKLINPDFLTIQE